MLPVRNMCQETCNLRPLDMQEIINELIAEPGSQYARSIQCLDRFHQRTGHWRLVNLLVGIPFYRFARFRPSAGLSIREISRSTKLSVGGVQKLLSR